MQLLQCLFDKSTLSGEIKAEKKLVRLSRSGAESKDSDHLKIGIVGFGTFGQFLARTFVRQGHLVHCTSRSDYAIVAKSMGAHFTPGNNVKRMIEAADGKLDVIVIATSILSFESVLNTLPISELKRMLVVDVLSVKVLPKLAMVRILDEDTDILATHPMFGPESGKHGWGGLPLVFERVRVRLPIAASFLRIFEREGCRMVEMACEERPHRRR